MANWRTTIETVLNDIIQKNNGLVTKTSLKLNSLLAKIDNIVKDGLASTTSTWSSKKIDNQLDLKVDKVAGKQLSDENYTSAEKSKLAGIEDPRYKGSYTSEVALIAAYPEGTGQSWHNNETGWEANVDLGPGEQVSRYAWDANDLVWVKQLGQSNAETADSIKQKYESNPDTNAYTDAFKSKLSGIEAGAQVNTVSPQDVSTVQADADAAQAAADAAGAAAAAAQSTANTAQTNAMTGRNAANVAQTDIDNYKSASGPVISVPDWGQELVNNLNF